MEYAICYVSTVSPNLNEQEIIEVLNLSQNLNIEHNITGIFLYSEGNFFQVLEGERNFVLGLFKKIKNDSRHFNIIIIFEKEVTEPQFKGYKIDFISLDTRSKYKGLRNYFSLIGSLDPSIQSTVKYLLKKFTNTIEPEKSKKNKMKL